jgi:endonuclease/exonuclease/phosphatase (EEP) superfamily protein YafD
LLATHPVPPVGAEYTELRNRQLTEISTFLADSFGPVILVGDLNTTPWSPAFKDLLQVTGLQNSMKGFGIQPSWPSFIPPLWIPLDHLLHSPDLSIQTRKAGPDIGSDHFPLEVTIQMNE